MSRPKARFPPAPGGSSSERHGTDKDRVKGEKDNENEQTQFPLRLGGGDDACGLQHGEDGRAGAVKKDNALEGTIADIKKRYALDTAPVQLYKSKNQVKNFVECVISRKPTISPAEVGARGAVLCQLCNMSYVYDTGFDWDPVKMEFANGTGKGISLKRDYCRNGWEVRV